MNLPRWKTMRANQDRANPAFFESMAPVDSHPSVMGSRLQYGDGSAMGRDSRTAPEKYLCRMVVRSGDKIVLVSMSDVVWIQSLGNLVRLHLENASYEHRTTIKNACTQLDPEHFLRVHRNAIVNLNYVTEFDLPRCGNAFVHLRNGKALPISGSARAVLRRGLLSQSYHSTDIGDG